jgi:hypothetical protein
MTGRRTWEAFIGFCNRERVKMTLMIRNKLFKSWQLHRWSRHSLCLWILNVHCHIHIVIKSHVELVNIHLNIIMPATLTSLN